MEKINIGRVILCGFVAGLVFIAVEFLLEGFIHIAFRVNERDLLLQFSRDVTLSGARYHIVNLSYLFGFCIFVMWIYAAIRPKFGPGPKTAVIASLVLWTAVLLFIVNNVNMGLFPVKLSLVSLCFGLVELPLATVAGAKLYKEG